MGANQKRFCEQCGAEVSANARFCGKCGQPMGAASLTPGPAPAGRVEAAPPQQVNMSVAQDQACAVAQAVPKKKKSGCFGRLLIIIVGLAMIILGLQGPILGLVGEPATAVVTDVSVSDREEHEYQVTYQFVAGGKTISGSWNQEALNVATLPQEGASVSIRYLPQLPTFSVRRGETSPTIGTLLVVALGAALILLNGKVRIG